MEIRAQGVHPFIFALSNANRARRVRAMKADNGEKLKDPPP